MKSRELNVLSEQSESKYWVYILRTDQNDLYIGQTDDIPARLKTHLTGHGAKFVKNKIVDIVHKEKFENRAAAMARERQLKGWTRAKKEALIKGDLDLLKKL